jgi:hypothetical protein
MDSRVLQGAGAGPTVMAGGCPWQHMHTAWSVTAGVGQPANTYAS